MSSLLTDLSERCELQAMDILALRKQVIELRYENERLKILAHDMAKELAIGFAEKTGDMPDGSWDWYEHMEDLGIDAEDLGIEVKHGQYRYR